MAHQFLNHAELVYRPGERELAADLFRLLGCTVVDTGGVYLSAAIDGEARQASNVFYASEVPAAQGSLEEALSSPEFREHLADYAAYTSRHPQRSFHIGLRLPDRATFDHRIDAVRQAEGAHPTLSGRVRLAGVFYPTDADAVATNMIQAFVWTDVVASGLLAIGQHIELQCWTESTSGVPGGH